MKELEELNNSNIESWSERLMPPGTKCRFIVGITVVPEYQGKGVGKALMKWGTEQADSDGVFCWVSSSMVGTKAFQKSGFNEVGRLEATLDEFSEGIKNPSDPSGKWGKYVWTFMKREPQLHQ